MSEPPDTGSAGERAGGVLGEGDVVGGFRIRRRLGAGGMGVVYAAWDESLHREVALKVLAPQLVDDEEFRTRFTREARTQARLDSAHVVAVHSYGEESGRLWIATQLVADGDLGHLLRTDGPPPTPVALDLVAQVAAGLADAHAGGLVHRDIKPGNVLVRRRDDGLRAYLADFGIARVADAELTRSGGAIGTPAYMAPELHLGAEAGVVTDVYSVGCLLWAVLTGHSPYGGPSEYRVIRDHVEAPVRQLAGSDPFTTTLNRTLARATAKRPEDRHPDAPALRADLVRLARWAQSEPVPPVVPLGPPGGAGGPGPSWPSGARSPSGTPSGGPHSGPGSGPHSGPHSGAAGVAAGGGPRSRGPLVAVVVGAALVAVAIVVGVLLGRSGGDDDPVAATDPSASPSAGATSGATPDGGPTVTPSEEASSGIGSGDDAADRRLAIDNLSTAIQDETPILPDSVCDCTAQRWVDAVGVPRLVEEGVLTEDLDYDPTTQTQDIDDDVNDAGEEAGRSCGEEYADDLTG